MNRPYRTKWCKSSQRIRDDLAITFALHCDKDGSPE